MRRCRGWLLGVTLWATVAAWPAMAQPTISVPLVPKGPKLTGTLADSLWKQGAEAKGFVEIGKLQPAQAQTQVRVLRDSSYLYLGFRCDEPNTKSLVSKTTDRDGSVYSDDCVEIFLDTNHDRDSYFHFAINSRGVIADARCKGRSDSDNKWNAAVLVKTSVAKGYWVAEVAIPLSSPSDRSLNVSPVAGDCWGVNLCRERYAGVKEFSSWSPTPGGFGQPANFGLMRFGGRYPTQEFVVNVESWGELSTGSNQGGGNLFHATVYNKMARPGNLRATLAQWNGKKWQSTLSIPVQVDPRGSATVAIPYAVSGVEGERFAVKLLDADDGRLVFRTEHPAMIADYNHRVWQVKDPLFKELLSSTPPGDQKNGAFYWFHSGIYSALRPFSLSFGLRFSLEEAYQELSEKRLMPIASSKMIDQYQFDQWSKKYPFKVLLDPDYRDSAQIGAPVIKGLPFFLDPRSKEVFFKDLRDSLTKHHDVIWAVYSQDEPWEKAYERGVEAFATLKDSYPFIREVDKEIREKYGFGKYGIPTSMADTNPFRWIAYHRWVNQQMIDMHKQIREEVNKIDPSIRVISMDPVAGHKPYSLDQIGPWCDLITHQLYPRANADQCEFGFVTKLLVDFTEKPVWPCTHVEHYAYSSTPEEVRELMSQVFRNGGKGLHLYIPDVLAHDQAGWPRITRYGSPERYRAIMETVDTVSRMNEVKMPGFSETALFYSEDTYQSFPAVDNIYPNEIEYAYTFLGPVAERWFQIVNENMIENGRARLASRKTLFMPMAKYMRKATATQILDWVRAGGALVCGDPEAFRFNLDGSSLQAIRDGLKLPVLGKEVKESSLRVAASPLLPGIASGTSLPVVSAAYRVTPAQGTQVLARFADGSPAITLTKVGKGQVIAFAFNPYQVSAIGDAGWKRFFVALMDGLKTNKERIWRFKLPEYTTVQGQEPEGICLTGNYVRWFEDNPTTPRNASADGSYRYSREPDTIADRATGDVSFANGKLTDRRKAIAAQPQDLKAENFAVSWSSPEAVEVVFDLKKPTPVLRAQLWYTGKLPASEFMGSADGTTWEKISEYPEGASTEDTLDLVLSAREPKSFRFVKLAFASRKAGESFTLGEVEIWGK